MKKILAIIIFSLLAFTGCKTKYVSVPEYHTQYVARTDTLLKQDSIYVKDSIFLDRKGDTVVINKVSYRDRYRNIYKVRNDTIIRRDSIPYPVVRELTKSEQRLIAVGKYSIAVIATLCVMLAIFWYRNKTC